MKEIKLTKGYVALVDDEDYARLCEHSWNASLRKGVAVVYARTTVKLNSDRRRKQWKTMAMHRMILGISDQKTFVDHINGDGLDNRRLNLRECTHAQNARNARKRKPKATSKYRGVHFDKGYGRKKWRACVRFEKKLVCLGRHTNEIDAAKAYNAGALKYFGEFASLNEI